MVGGRGQNGKIEHVAESWSGVGMVRHIVTLEIQSGHPIWNLERWTVGAISRERW